MTNQPIWKFRANLGDVDPFTHGGYLVVEDTTGVYAPEAIVIEVSDDEQLDGEPAVQVFRFALDRLKTVEDPEDHRLYLVPFAFDEASWRYPVSTYDEWFHKDLAGVAKTVDADLAELRARFCSEDSVERAFGYRDVGQHWGFENFDSYPDTLTQKEARKRYGHYLREAR